MQTRLWRVALMGVMCMALASCTRGDKQFRADFDGDDASGTGQISNISNARGDLTDEDLGPDVASVGALRGEHLAQIPQLGSVYFDYNSAALRGDTQEALDEHARFLRTNQQMRVQVEGHCDERGTLEYNLALGERRAQSVRKYLVGRGVSSDRLYTISYGEEKAAELGHDESAWRWNRRAEFRIAR